MFATPFTTFHVILSLVAIAAGLIVQAGLLSGQHRAGLVALFLATNAATLITGFLFPFNGFTPAIGVGIIASAILIVTLLALYAFHLRGIWRPVYVAGAVLSLYLNVFVLVVQLFQKVPALNALAPTGSEPPFAIAQGAVLVLFILAGLRSLRRFHPPVA